MYAVVHTYIAVPLEYNNCICTKFVVHIMYIVYIIKMVHIRTYFLIRQ